MSLEKWYCSKYPECQVTAPAGEEGLALIQRHMADNHVKREYITKDSGVRAAYESGMVRDTQENKPRFDLLFPKGIPYEEQPLYRVAMLMARGVAKYGERNWEKAASEEEYDRFGGSGLRHNIQDICGETDEDHPAAVIFNAIARISLQAKGIRNG